VNSSERRAVAGGAALSGTGAPIKKPKHKTQHDEPKPKIKGERAQRVADDDEIYQRAVSEYRKTTAHLARQTQQVIPIARGPVALVFVADLHLGNSGVDYERCFREAEIIARTPGMWLVTAGDLLDNFLFAKMMNARLKARISIDEEWALVRRYLKIVAKKLLVSVSGNHDNWTLALTGIDYFREVVAQIAPDAIYDTDDVTFRLEVGKAEFPIRVRHLWQGSSIYNLTHGIERAAKFDGGFAVGVGGHTHASGLVRTFDANGQTGMAVLCGSYKRFDPYAKTKGFYRPNASTAMTVIFDESGAMVGVDRLDMAARLITKLRK
jgi:predicted phosphodiesterase